MLPPRELGSNTYSGHNPWDHYCVERAAEDPEVSGERCAMCRPVAVREDASAAIARELGS